jgi:hypothetical protein
MRVDDVVVNCSDASRRVASSTIITLALKYERALALHML